MQYLSKGKKLQEFTGSVVLLSSRQRIIDKRLVAEKNSLKTAVAVGWLVGCGPRGQIAKDEGCRRLAFRGAREHVERRSRPVATTPQSQECKERKLLTERGSELCDVVLQ